MSGFNIFCDPSSGLQQAVRVDYATPANTVGNVFGNCSAILGGIPSGAPTNCNCADLSVILMGDGNIIDVLSGGPPNGSFNSIINGSNNYTCGCFNTVGGGANNQAIGFNSFIGAGDSNFVGAACAVIVGGCHNMTNYTYAAIVGGVNNKTEACATFIGGGDSNCIIANPGTPNWSSIVGGQQNNIGGTGAPFSSEYSFIGGGQKNNITGCESVIGGGTINKMCCANDSFIGGGCKNNIFNNGSSIVGGQCHNIKSVFSFVGGGDTNAINVFSDCSFIGGGLQNSIGAASNYACGSIFSVIAGGSNNCIDDTGAATSYGIIGGGTNNYIAPGSNYSSIFGGSNHCVNGNNLFVGVGDTNYICSTAGLGPVSCSAIAGGWLNTISDDGTITSDLSFIGGGCQNQICSLGATIGGGVGNCIVGNFYSGHPTIGYSAIGGGQINCICGYNSFIGGGQENSIWSLLGVIQGSAIAGGIVNTISDNGTAPVINSFIGSGEGNNIYGSNSSIAGGSGNQLWGQQSFIGGGESNSITLYSDCSFISGGWFNSIGATGLGATYSAIGGGQGNHIDDIGAATTYGVIGGGYQNNIAAGTNFASIFSGSGNGVAGTSSSILGGDRNILTGSCSSILGGCGNSDGGYDWAGAFGCNVAAVAPCTFHANNFAAQNMPSSPGPLGTFYIYSSGGINYVAIS